MSRRDRTERLLATARSSPVVGTFVFEFATTGIGPIVSAAGADFLVLDAEHSGFSWETLRTVTAAARGTGLVVMIRVPLATRRSVTQALDLGADGVIVPDVRSPGQAADVVSWARYPPQGSRGAAFGVAHDDYRGDPPAEVIREADAAVLVLVQIESAAGLENCSAIAGTPGLAGLWLGQYDLTLSMGIPGRLDHRDYLAARAEIAAHARRAGIAAGMLCGSAEELAEAFRDGYRLLGYGTDVQLYRAALAAGLDQVPGR